MVDQLHGEYEKARGHLGALKQCLDNLDVSPEWSNSLQRLVRELTDQLEHAVDQAQPPQAQRRRYQTRPPRLR
ncbi:hypothetical protein MOQ72_05660 [Saccharopolyspora sp. K220]|uniref:hypothetical protein n=1 Tax=Saccharopolyspora soli TaxID=2926618 RepID=UPI001F5ABE3C|nr:hypothetical protein [Saccharopolyspora soli]MCI2416905.1 hypothetical protein [Saccharopolyspora soli]